MIFGPSDAEFHLELEDTKKCIHQKLPKQRDSNGRSEMPPGPKTPFPSDYKLMIHLISLNGV